MGKFLVEVREVHVSTIEVEAENKAEAISKVKDGEGEVISECCHTVESDTWNVSEKPA